MPRLLRSPISRSRRKPSLQEHVEQALQLRQRSVELEMPEAERVVLALELQLLQEEQQEMEEGRLEELAGLKQAG